MPIDMSVEGIRATLETPLPGLQLSTVVWSILFAVVCIVPGCSNKSFDFKNRVVSIVHAIVSAILATLLVGLAKPLDIGGPNTPNQILVLNVSCGYFVYDYVACCIHDALQRKFDAMNFFHHLATLSGLATGLLVGRSGAELGLCLILMEVSNPFMHMIHIFRELGVDGTLADLNKMAFALIFTLARILAGPPLTYYTVMNKDSHPLVKVGAVGILVVSLLWFHKIVSMVTRSKKPKADGPAGDAPQVERRATRSSSKRSEKEA